jgi:hypothetical protein
MIGGADVVLEYPGVLRASGGLDIAARHFAARWPSAVFQDGASGGVFTTYSSIPFGRLTEMFIYRDAMALESWTNLGADAGNANAMVHLIADEAALTVVVDDPTDPTIRSIVREVRDLLTSSQAWVRAA